VAARPVTDMSTAVAAAISSPPVLSDYAPTTLKKKNECSLLSHCWISIAATGAPEMRKMEKQSCSFTHPPARHRGWNWSDESTSDGEEHASIRWLA